MFDGGEVIILGNVFLDAISTSAFAVTCKFAWTKYKRCAWLLHYYSTCEMELIARARRASETNRCGYSDTKYERSYNDFMGKALQEKYKKEIEAIVAAKEAERRI